MTISAAMITLNEEDNIELCLESVSWANEIVVVDGGSTDRTVPKAKKFTSAVYEIPFKNFAEQKNNALGRTTGDWVFFIDADERVPKELAEEILKTSRSGDSAAYAVGRLTYFFGKRLRFSGTQDDFPIRLFSKGRARFDQPVHEQVITDLPVRRLKNPLIHYSTRDLSHYGTKVRTYVPFEIEILKKQKRKDASFQLVIGTPAKFFQLYFIKAGILDGLVGLQYAVLSSYYFFLKWWKYLFAAGNIRS